MRLEILSANAPPAPVIAWSDGSVGTLFIANASFGSYSVTVTDQHLCSYSASVQVSEAEDRCPDLSDCLRFFGSGAVFFRCAEAIAEPLIWSASAWDLCAARALIALARAFTVPAGMDDPEQADGGTIFVTLLLGEAIWACQAARLRCELDWRALLPYFAQNATVKQLYFDHDLVRGRYVVEDYAAFKHEALSLLFDLADTDVITAGPNTFDNEIIFAPSLCRPTRLNRVTVLTVKVPPLCWFDEA